MRIIIFLLPLILFVLPTVVFGQVINIPCGNEGQPMCTTNHATQFANNIINFLITMLAVVAVIVLVISGFKMVLSAGDDGAWKEAKQRFTNIVIGLLIILAAWVIVDTVLKVLTDKGIEEWTNFPAIQSSATTENIATNNNPAGDGCPTCVKLTGIPCKSATSCSVSPTYAAKLENLSSADIVITEAWPPTRTHQAACHSNGTCTDVAFADRNFSADRVKEFQSQAAAAGFRAVYEPPSGVSCTGYTNCLPHSTTKSTGHHFSLYLQ